MNRIFLIEFLQRRDAKSRRIVFGSSLRCFAYFRGFALMVVLLLLSLPVFSEGTNTVVITKEISAESLYEKAVKERAEGKPKQAIETVATAIALNTTNQMWFAKSELLSAELYLEMGMTNAADVTARQVQVLYPETDFAEKANALRERISK